MPINPDLVIFLLCLAALLLAGISYQAFGSYRDSRRYPAPGRILDAGCAPIHVNEQGRGEPAVVLEAGIAGSSLSWALVQPQIAEFTRVCSYDRAGLGWSGKCRKARTVEQMVSELSGVLALTGLPKPYILAGHSFGGLLIRAYAHLRPDEVCGLLFVDPVSVDYWAHCELKEQRRVRLGARLSRRGAWLARMGVVRLALAALVAGGRRFPKLLSRVAAGQGRRTVEGLLGEVRKLPPEVWPLVRAHWSRPKCFEAMALYLESLPANAEVAMQMSIPAHIPFIVLSAATATEKELQERDHWVQENPKGRHIRVEQSGHWLQLEQSALVVSAIRELVELAKT